MINKTKKRIKGHYFQYIPDLTDKNEHDSIKNMLYVFLIFMGLFFGCTFYLSVKSLEEEAGKISVPERPSALEMNIRKMVKGSPISRMAPYISKEDQRTAKFLVAIAKKESNWGKYSPKKGGKECYNYWGYRGEYNQTSSGYSCFDSERQAVRVVGGRIKELIDQGINTPQDMIVWKCGETCDGHDPESVRKWIADVDFYYKKINS
jgi:hypothetical protein